MNLKLQGIRDRNLEKSVVTGLGPGVWSESELPGGWVTLRPMGAGWI